MSESSAGSDLAALSTRADLSANRWVINGQKTWTSFAARADYCYLICRTAVGRHDGISEIIVPMVAEGVSVRPIRDMSDRLSFCEVVFDNVTVPRGNLVGREGAAFSQTMRQLDHERGSIDRLVSNRYLYLQSLAACNTSDPLVRQEVAWLEARYRIGRIMILQNAAGATGGRSAITKAFCTEYEARVARFVAHASGAEAMLWGDAAEAICAAPSYTISGGTAEILRNIVAERVLGLPRMSSP